MSARVSVGHNAPEWHISNIASVVAGGLAVGLYTTSSLAGLQYKAAHSRANILVVEDEEQLEKLLECRDSLAPDLQCIVQYTGQPSHPGVLSWSQLLEVGRAQSDLLLQERLDQQAVNQACMVVYTSGTTGTTTRGNTGGWIVIFLGQINPRVSSCPRTTSPGSSRPVRTFSTGTTTRRSACPTSLSATWPPR